MPSAIMCATNVNTRHFHGYFLVVAVVWLSVVCTLCLARPKGGASTHVQHTPHQRRHVDTETQRHGSALLNRVRKHSSIENTELTEGDNSGDTIVVDAASTITTTAPSENKRASFRQLETRIMRQVEESVDDATRRLTSQMNEKLDRLNNSVTIDYLYNVYHYLIEEVELGRHFGEMRAGEIEKVRRATHGHGKDIVRLEQTLNNLAESVQNLTRIVQGLQAAEYQSGDSHTGIEHVTTSPTPSYPSTTTLEQGTPKEKTPIVTKFPKDCQDVYKLGGMTFEGDYYMQIQPSQAQQPFEAHCRMFDDAGWLVIQRRMDGSVDFYRDWRAYRDGFGDIRGEFWLGNERIHQITSQGDYMLQIQMTDFDGRQHYARYDHFRLEGESRDYELHVHGYHGDAGDSLTPAWGDHDGQRFSTFDRDNDERFYDNCAERFHGAWWFKSCFESHLNGHYYQRGEHDDPFRQNGIQWNTVGHYYSLRTVLMMVRPSDAPAQHDNHVPGTSSNSVSDEADTVSNETRGGGGE